MKLKFIMSLCLAGASLGMFAQTHAEGVEYYKADQFNNALELLERNYNNPGTDKAIANYYLGLLNIKMKDMAKAEKYFQDGLQINPNYPYNYIGLGSLALKQGQLKQAEEYFKKAEKLNKKDASVDVAIARAYYESGSDGAVKYAKQVEKAMKNARKHNILEPEIFRFEGDVALDNGDINEAAAKYDMAISYNPQATDAYVKYANIMRNFNPGASIQKLEELLRVNPNSALGLRELANFYYDQANYKKAAEQYGKYVQNPSHFKSDEDRYAFLLFYGADYKKGYDYATQLLASNPDNFTAQRFQFMNAAQLDDMAQQLFPLAQKLWTKHEADPKLNSLSQIDYNLLSMAYTDQKDYDTAKKVIEEAIKSFPDVTSYSRSLAYNCLYQENYPEAAKLMEKYIQSAKEPSANDYMAAANFLYYAGALGNEDDAAKKADYAKATEYANRVISMDANNFRPYRLLGDIALQNGDNATGRAQYEKALSLIDQTKNPKDYEALSKALGNK